MVGCLTYRTNLQQLKTKLLISLMLVTFVFGKNEHYIGWKSYFIGPSSKDHIRTLVLLRGKMGLDFLSPPRMDKEALVLVPPKQQVDFIKKLENLNITYRTHAEDVKAELDLEDEIRKNWTRVISRNGGSVLPYNTYLHLDVIYAYMLEISMRHPNIVTMVTAGYSFEGRPLRYLKISTTNFTNCKKKKKIIFIDAGIHSREWIAPPTVTWIIHKLTDNVTERDMLNDYDWILMPVVNPDGYEFSFKEERLWRKTRSFDFREPKSVECPGVDGNRNYDFAWGGSDTIRDPCSEIYGGKRPFSEPETRAVRDILRTYVPRLSMYITMHSFGSMILYPWGHNGTVSRNSFNLHITSTVMARAIRNASLPIFPTYDNGNSAKILLYTIGGAADDYAHSLGVPYTYTFELPGFGGGMRGFELDPMYIEQVCRETWIGIVAGIRKAADMARREAAHRDVCS